MAENVLLTRVRARLIGEGLDLYGDIPSRLVTATIAVVSEAFDIVLAEIEELKKRILAMETGDGAKHN